MYYTVEETAGILKISVLAVYKLIKEKNLPVVKLGERLTRIPKTELEEWMSQQINEK